VSRSIVHLRVLVMLLLSVPSIATVLPDRVAAAQTLDKDAGLYQGPTFGHLFRWNPEAWQVAEASSDDEADLLALESDVTHIQFAAYQAFDGDPERCLDDATARLQEQGPRSFTPAVYEDGTSAEEQGEGFAYGAFLVVPDTGTSDIEYVAQVECRTLIRDEAVLETTSFVASADYATGANDGMLLIDNLALPRGAFVTAPDTSRPLTDQRIYVSPDSDAMLEITIPGYDANVSDASLPDPGVGSRWVSIEVEVTNTGDEAGEVDVDRISISDQYGTVFHPSYFEWHQATGSLDEPRQTLTPGDSVAATLLYQLDDAAEIIRVECGCGADPDVPVFIAQLQRDPTFVYPPPPFSPCNPIGWDMPRIIEDQAGEEIATMTGTLWESGDTFQILLAIENSGADRLTIDTRDFLLTVSEKTSYGVDEVSWDLGADDARRQRLAPGERTLALLSFTLDDEISYSTILYYLGPADDQRQEVAAIAVGGGCGGGGRPKILVSQ
jgi:hypothetical protein